MAARDVGQVFPSFGRVNISNIGQVSATAHSPTLIVGEKNKNNPIPQPFVYIELEEYPRYILPCQ